MDRVNSRIPQAFGYTICFIAVIVILMSIKQVVDAAFDLSDPLRAEAGGRPIMNFELYKSANRSMAAAKAQSGPMPLTPTQAKADTLSDAQLRKLYDAERQEAIGNARFHAIRSLIGNLLSIVVAAALFRFYWRWLRQRDPSPAVA